MASVSKLILDALRLLTTPDKENVKEAGKQGLSDSGRENQFDRLLEQKLSVLHEKLTTVSFSGIPCLRILQEQTSSEVCRLPDIRWSFTTVCLHLLLLLQRDMEVAVKEFEKQMLENPPSMKTPHQAPQLSPDVLSIEQEKTVVTSLQFIVCLGVCPNLDKGVGIPVERRSGFGNLLGETALCEMPREKRHVRLGVCGRVLTACLDIPSLSALILSRHLSDLLAILIQLCHSSSPQHKSQEETKSDFEKLNKSLSRDERSSENISTKNFSENASPRDFQNTNVPSQSANVSQRGRNEDVLMKESQSLDSEFDSSLDILLKKLVVTESDQMFAEVTLPKLIAKVHPSMLVRDLVMLQGGPKPMTKVKLVKGVPLPVSPTWLRRVCGRLMTDILMKPQGLLHVLQGMLPPSAAQTGVKGADTGDWQKCQAVAMVIAHCPMQTSSVEEYYKHIAPQMLALLHHKDSRISQRYLRVIVSLVKEMSQQHPQLVQRHLLVPILAPLQMCVDVQGFPCSENKVVVPEADLSLCIQDVHKLLVTCTETQTIMYPALSKFILVLFHLYCSCKTGISHLRTPCEEVLITFLKYSNSDVALEILWLLTTGIHGNKVKDVHHLPSRNVFQTGSAGGMTCVWTNRESGDGDGVPLETQVQSLVTLVKHLQENTVAGDFFIRLLKELTVMVSSDSSNVPQPAGKTSSREELYMLEQQDRQAVELFNRSLIILNLLASMSEELGPSCFKKTQQILEFVKTTLDRGVEVCKATTEELTGLFESETLTMALGLLTAIMGGAVQVEEADRSAMQELLPLLDEIRENHFSDEVREMADDIRIAIATRGAVWSELMKNKAKMKKANKQAEQTKTKPKKENEPSKPLIEVISETSTEDASKPVSDNGSSSSIQESPVSNKTGNEPLDKDSMMDLQYSAVGDYKGEADELEQAFLELCDPEIPVRGHGLLRLTHLVQNKDASALARSETLVKVFEENLQHPDSYLYLASVNGLAALADRCPDQVVPRLAHEFGDFDSSQRKKSPEMRMKLGESLMKAARNLGDMVPKYRDILLAAILSGVRSPDALVRASCLSNLAEVSQLLRFSLGNVLHEVFQCCSSVLRTDTDSEARKAAALTLNQLLQGLGSDAPKVLEDVLGELYRLLKLVHTSDIDPMVRTHALLALNELDTIMRAALFPQQKLQKKITVLHPD